MSVNKIINTLKDELNNNEDIVSRILSVGKYKIVIIYIKSMIDKELLAKCVIEPLFKTKVPKSLTLLTIKEKFITAANCELITSLEDVLNHLLKNQLILFIDGKSFLSIDIENYPIRALTEPPTSAVLQGPREGFVEDIKTNITLVRRRFPTKYLKMEKLEVGRFSKTRINVCYLDNVADKKVVKEIINKIKKIDIDGIIDAQYIVSFLEQRPHSLFKQVGMCEKPDILCAKILEGRVGILIDNTPIALTLPFIYLEDMQSSNDYYSKNTYASYIRIVRFMGIIISVIAPAVFLALRLYHYKILPLKFLITISNSTQNLPFTPFIELLFILILFEILYEVSLRLPRYLGLATSIVGALILGDTGVKAGLISPPGVMIIALSMIAIYTVPDQIYQITLLRFIFLLLGGTVGIFGIVGGIVFFINHLNTFDSYGAPYLAPFSPYVKSDKKDAFLKVPLKDMYKRPMSFNNKNKTRLKTTKEGENNG